MNEKEIKDDLDKITKLLSERQGIRIFNSEEVETLIDFIKHKNSYMELIEIHNRNPKALEAWVWLYDMYDTAIRFRSVGNFFIGTIKYIVLLGASAMLLVDKPVLALKNFISNISSIFGGP